MTSQLLIVTISLIFCSGVLSRVLEKRNSDFCDNNAAGVHANPDNCYGYIMCDMAGNTHEMPCPAGLKFNPSLLVCDWPRNVECEDGSGDVAGYFPPEPREELQSAYWQLLGMK